MNKPQHEAETERPC